MTKLKIPFPSSGGTYVHRDGQLHRVAPGAEQASAAPFVARPASVVPDALSIADIAGAIALLDKDDKTQWTKSGKPRVEAVERVLDAGITESQRDAAWASFQSMNQPED